MSTYTNGAWQMPVCAWPSNSAQNGIYFQFDRSRSLHGSVIGYWAVHHCAGSYFLTELLSPCPLQIWNFTITIQWAPTGIFY